jgi:hypothetical protein
MAESMVKDMSLADRHAMTKLLIDVINQIWKRLTNLTE